MAVYQISRIQVRRGQMLTGTGMPQLASGELGWAVDTQELYVGNGSVTEGAPAVGNTRLLTINDLTVYGNILSIGQYSYDIVNPVIQTGVNASSPVFRSIQNKLDDIASSGDFGLVGDGATDNSAMLQQAINTLFMNASEKASLQTPAGTNSRVILNILPGTYNINQTIYIPSYATIVGAGADKTIFNFTPTTGNTTPLFMFVNDTSSPGVYNTNTNLQYTNQARHIKMSGFSILTPNGTNIGMQLDSVRDGLFEDINITGYTNSYTVYNATNIGIVLNAFSSTVTCEHNTFKNINISSTDIAVYAQQDILNNTFDNLYIYDAVQGFSLGAGSLGGGYVGQQYGPRQTVISNVKFYKIKQQAVYLERGEFNNVTNCRMADVGNNLAGSSAPVYPQVFFKTVGNGVSNILSDRADALENTNTIQYVPEVTGNVFYKSYSVNSIPVGQITSAVLLFRLPASTDQVGNPNGTISYNVDYIYKSSVSQFSRSGNLYLAADLTHATIQLSDDYNFAGSDSGNSIAQVLTFSAFFLDATGAKYTGSIGQVATTIAIYYTNNLTNDAGTLTYSYSANSHTI